MDPQLNDRLRIIEERLEENNRLLKKVRNTQRAGHYIRILYWAFIIFAGFGAYYFIKPYLGELGSLYGVTTGNGTNLLNSKDLLNQLNQFKELTK